MKNKIKRISKGDFEVIQPDVQFSETHMIMQISEGEIYEGSFTLQSRKEGDIRGLVYPSSFRIELKNQGFQGNPVQVGYTFDGSGMLPGDIENGKFTIVCDGGEYDIAYTAVIEKPFVITDYGKVQTIKEFKELAEIDFDEAWKLFRSKKFFELLKYEDQRIIALYSNMRKWSLDKQALEEFLVASKQKERIYLLFQEEEAMLSYYSETTTEMVTLTKNTWGYLPVEIFTIGDFLSIEKNQIITEDFIGNDYYLEYMVNIEKLHTGYNYGKIIVQTPLETIEYPVTVHQQSTHTEKHGEEKLMFGCLLKSYMACVSGNLELKQWTKQAVELVKQLQEIAPENEFYELLMAHVYLRGGCKEEGKWFLENYNYNRFAIGKKAELGSYYLFLTGLLSKDESYIKKVTEELNKSYEKHPTSWQLLCMLLNIDVKYRNYSEKIRVLQKCFSQGANQIPLYIEAYLCFQEKSSLLKKLGHFEMKVLDFATKYRMITKQLALYTANLASQEKIYQEKLYQILSRSYSLYPEKMILNAICTLLIKGDKKDNKYFVWYERAVEEGLRIAKLYEYYVMSTDKDKMNKAFPRTVWLYFVHGSSLDYKNTAFLYANILTYEDKESRLFSNYHEQMESFSWKQLEKRRINEDLRVLYKYFCNEPDLNMERMKAIYDISHIYLVKTNAPHMKYVVVIEKSGAISQRIAYRKEGAKILLHHKTSRIVWEADDGKFYADSIEYELKRLCFETQFVEMYKDKKELFGTVVEESQENLTFENIKKYSIDYFGEEKVFRFCSKYIREEGKEEDYLTYLCFSLLERGLYDTMTLIYLAEYYCGATKDMKKVWSIVKKHGGKSDILAERIITQMLYSETMFNEEQIFLDYYAGSRHTHLKQAYLSYVSNEYIVNSREIKKEIVEVILNEYEKENELPIVCKLAVIKFYARHAYQEKLEDRLKLFLQELCERQLVFPFYLEYKEEWLQEVLLHDKVMIQYKAKKDGKVKLLYKIGRKTIVEELQPVYANIYVKEFILFEGESLSYTFKEENGENLICEEMGECRQKRKVGQFGKYGRLNAMSKLDDDNLGKELCKYCLEEKLAEELFEIY
ncbi:DUF5717 family protein [Faecalimonas sp.]